MKILRITESQYSRLVNTLKPLLPPDVIFNREEDKNELSGRIIDFLDGLNNYLIYAYTDIDLYIDKIEDGVVYIDGTKYNINQKNNINGYIKWFVEEYQIGKFKDTLTFDSGGIKKKEKNCSCMDKQNPEIAIRYDCNDMMPIECQELEPIVINTSDSEGDLIFHSRVEFDKDLNRLSQKLIDDIATAAKNAGVVLQLTYARKDHRVGGTNKEGKSYRSRHCYGTAVDISRVQNDSGDLKSWGNESEAKERGIYEKIIKFNDELEKMGYKRNSERTKKAFLTFGYEDHDNHIHVSNLNVNSDFKNTYNNLKKWCAKKRIGYKIKGNEKIE